MIRHIGAFGALMVMLAALGCGNEPLVSHWVDAPLVIDGDGAEWPISYTTYVEDTRGIIGVANDDSTIYLLFRFRDEKTARKAMVGGATMWWSPRGTKDRDMAIRFAPVVSLRDIMPGQPPAGAEGEGSPGPGQMPGQTPPDGGFGSGPRSVSGEDTGWMPPGRGFGRPTLPTPEDGVLHHDVTLVTAKDPVGTPDWSDPHLRVRTGYKKGTYTYELALPLRGVGDSEVGITAGPGAKVHFAVSLGGVPEEDQDLIRQGAQRPPSRPDDGEGSGEGPEGGHSGGPGGQGGIGGGGGRGPGGQGPGARSSPFADLTETIDVAFAITLAERAQ